MTHTKGKYRILSVLIAFLLLFGLALPAAALTVQFQPSRFGGFWVDGVNVNDDWVFLQQDGNLYMYGMWLKPKNSDPVQKVHVRMAASGYAMDVYAADSSGKTSQREFDLEFTKENNGTYFLIYQYPAYEVVNSPSGFFLYMDFDDVDPGTEEPDPQGDMYITSAGVRNGILLNEYGMHGSQFDTAPDGFQVPSRSMPLTVHDAPSAAKSYAIYVDDITYPWTHWMAVNIKETSIPANASKSGAVSMVQGTNDFGTVGYGGPTPPDGDHEYDMTIFALDVESVSLSRGFDESDFWNAIQDHIIAEDTITATYRYNRSADPDEPEEPEPPVDPEMEYELTLVAGNGGTISLGASGTYRAGDAVEIGATPDEGYRFSSWTSSNGGTFQNAYGATTTFSLPRGDTTITANFSRIGSGSSGGGSGSSGGSSSGGTNVSDQQRASAGGGSGTGAVVGARSANVNADGSVNTAAILAELTAALSKATGDTVILNVKNATSISPDTLKGLANAAAQANKTVALTADTLSADGKTVLGRLYLEPAKLTGLSSDLKLTVSTEGTRAKAVQETFGKYFANNMQAVQMEQQGSWGTATRVAVRLDGSFTSPTVYSYDPSTNNYSLLSSAGAYADSNDYLHFYLQSGGTIIISDGALAKK